MPSKWIVRPLRVIADANPKQYPSISLQHAERPLPGRRDIAEITMFVWAFGGFSLAALLNQIAIALCRRAQVATGPDHHEQWSPEVQSRR